MKKRILVFLLTLALAVAMVIPMASPAVAAGPLVGSWHFEGNALDSSGNGNNGTVYGSVIYVPGIVGQSLSFNGSNVYVDCGSTLDNSLTSGVTLEAWIKPTAEQWGGVISNWVTFYSNTGFDFFLWNDDGFGDTHGQLFIDFGNGTNLGRTYWNIPSDDWYNQWHHVAATWNGSNVRLFVDSIEVNTLAYSGTYADPTTNTLIGAIQYGGAIWPFNGLIDEVRIWNQVVPIVATTTWTVDDDRVQCPDAYFTTIQAAINASNPGDTINVYPGTYDPKINIAVPGWGGTYPAMGIVVWKANLTIKAVDPDPANTVIQNTLGAWMDWWRIQRLTGGQWIGPSGTAQTGGFNPGTSASPNAIMIVKPGVTIEGFTIQAHCFTPASGYNGSGVLIGGVAPGDPNSLGADNNTVKNCVFSDVWHAVYIWHSSNNTILNNTIAALGSTGHWAGISVYDGYTNEQIALGHPSENNVICNNTLADKGIFLGAWAPTTWTSLAGSKVCCNTTTQVGVAYAHGPVIVGCNGTGFWESNTDKVINITKINFIQGDPTQSPATLSAQLVYGGSSDGSGIPVVFSVNGVDYTVNTIAGGLASTSVALTPNVYNVDVKVVICDCCQYTSSGLLVVYDPSAGFVTGGGWIMSPAGAYAADTTLTGKATFGFVSKYLKNAIVPTGNTEFQFKVGNLNFKSTSYEWLVVTGSNYAKYKGIGTINGAGEYKFQIWAGDGTGAGDADTFRIKIWTEDNEGNETVVYDNVSDQVIGGGSIVVHTGKK